MAKEFVNPSRVGNVTYRDDLSRAMRAMVVDVFTKNLEKIPSQYQDIVKVIKSEHMEEAYDTVGNLKAAEIKEEGKPINYGAIKEGHETKLKNYTVANGIAFTHETVEDEKWGIVAKTKGAELARTMNDAKEKACAKVWDSVTTEVSADGKPYASHEHPLLNSSEKNDNLVEGIFNIDNYKKALKLFNHWKNHGGDYFPTTPDTIIAHRDRQMQLAEIYKSQLVPYENTNTLNVIPSLKTVFNNYINENAVHILDSTIDSAILQERSKIKFTSEWDDTTTLDWRFAAFERYKAGMINPGFGFVTITGQ